MRSPVRETSAETSAGKRPRVEQDQRAREKGRPTSHAHTRTLIHAHSNTHAHTAARSHTLWPVEVAIWLVGLAIWPVEVAIWLVGHQAGAVLAHGADHRVALHLCAPSSTRCASAQLDALRLGPARRAAPRPSGSQPRGHQRALLNAHELLAHQRDRHLQLLRLLCVEMALCSTTSPSQRSRSEERSPSASRASASATSSRLSSCSARRLAWSAADYSARRLSWSAADCSARRLTWFSSGSRWSGNGMPSGWRSCRARIAAVADRKRGVPSSASTTAAAGTRASRPMPSATASRVRSTCARRRRLGRSPSAPSRAPSAPSWAPSEWSSPRRSTSEVRGPASDGCILRPLCRCTRSRSDAV
jgi:hypothetical protein